jgi:hypothetical protein
MRCEIVSLEGYRCEREATDFWEIDNDAGINCCLPDFNMLVRNWTGAVQSETVSDWRRLNELLAQAQLMLLPYEQVETLEGKRWALKAGARWPSFQVVWEDWPNPAEVPN